MAALGYSIAVEITNRRLQRAKRLLAETDSPVYHVASSAGFGSVISFNRVFREKEGQTPQMFRERIAAKAVRSRS
jgi:transcriptional regulator GlxA family with amidase domain